MDGFKRPVKPQGKPPVTPRVPVAPELPDVAAKQPSRVQKAPRSPEAVLAEINLLDEEVSTPPPAKRLTKRLIIGGGIIAALLVMMVGVYAWYTAQLQPVDTGDDSVQRVEIKEGSSLSFVAQRLEERGLIRSGLAFKVLANIEGEQGAIKAGACGLTPAQSAKEILDKIITGCQDFKSVTFYPGATLEPSLYAKSRATAEGKEFKDMSIRASLGAAGYSDDAITKAFAASYDSPLFAGKPAAEGYEGYVFGETYFIDPTATAEDALKAAFDHFYALVKSEDLEAKFKAHGLNLYQGITLASIVGRELDCEGKPTEERKQRCYGYQRQIAQVFYNRLASGMSLGSDVTSIYASDKLGVASSVTIDSPYNTRKYPGLTPGPIATAGKLALLSVAQPSEGDELFFVAGDDGLIYFARDNAGHEANVRNHCKLGCGSL